MRWSISNEGIHRFVVQISITILKKKKSVLFHLCKGIFLVFG